MDAIGQIPIVVRPSAPTTTKVSQPVSPTPFEGTGEQIPQPGTTQASPEQSLQTAEETRIKALQRAAQAATNSFVVSDKTFSIFKDSTGQYITRFTSLRDGRVTYIPEPELLKSSNQTTAVSLLNIQA